MAKKNILFAAFEASPFIKTGGLGDVMYALPRALVKQNCDVKVILPRYRCIPQEYQDKMIYQLKGSQRFNALKYVHIYHRNKNISRGEPNVEFLGL